MENKIFEQKIAKDESPSKEGYYNTNKGVLYWVADEKMWSPNAYIVSDEHPEYWYLEISASVKKPSDDESKPLSVLLDEYLPLKSVDNKTISIENARIIASIIHMNGFVTGNKYYHDNFTFPLSTNQIDWIKIEFELNKYIFDYYSSGQDMDILTAGSICEWLKSRSEFSFPLYNKEGYEQLLVAYGRHLRMKLGMYAMYNLKDTTDWAKEYLATTRINLPEKKPLEKVEIKSREETINKNAKILNRSKWPTDANFSLWALEKYGNQETDINLAKHEAYIAGGVASRQACSLALIPMDKE